MGTTTTFPGSFKSRFDKFVSSDTSFFGTIRTHFSDHKYFYLVLLAVSAVYIFPLLFVQLPTGHDIYFHMTRVSGLAEELKIGNFPARIYSTVFYNYGYAAPLFYGDWLLYFPALLVVGGMKVVTAYKTFILFCAVLAAVSMYFSAKIIFNNKKAACFTAILYSLSTYMATDAFVRHANGEMQSFIFIPIALAGLYNILTDDCKHWMLLPLGLCGILVTHTLTAVMTVVIFILFSLFFLIDLIQKPKKLVYIAASAGVFFLLSAAFIFPMIEQLSSVKFWATDGTSANYYGSLEARSMQSVYSLFSVFNSTAKVGADEWFIPQGVGLALPVMVGWKIAYFKKTSSMESTVFLLFAILALFMTSKYFPWELLQAELGTIQFPWRIFVFATLFIALFGGAMVKKLEGTTVLSIFLSIVIVITFYSVSNTVYGRYKRVYEAALTDAKIEYPFKNNIGLGEFLPTGTNKGALAARGQILSTDNAYISDYTIKHENGVLIVEYSDVKAEDFYIDVPLIMYKGYKATFETPDGTITELPISYGTNNTIRVSNLKTGSGTVRVWYAGTSVQDISFIVTLLSFGGVIAYYVIIHKRRKAAKAATSQLVPDITEDPSSLLEI